MTETPLILISDHRGDGLTEVAERLTKAGFHTELTHNLRATCERVAVTQPALVLIDPLVEGGTRELELLDRRRTGSAPFPVLVIVDRGSPEAAMSAARALQRGAWDLIHRDAPREELALRIERLFEQAHHMGELSEMRHRALHDDRTDLLRPSAFQTRLEEHFSAAERHGFGLALCIIDLDDFGTINKSFDHTVGDRVITSVGEAIRRNLRAEDVAGRLGGDEFAVLLPYTGRIEGAHVVRRLRDEIHGLSGPLPGMPEINVQVSASLGFETFDGRDLETVEELRAHAEAALREAKNTGGNRGVYFRALRRPA
jgi:diguanylate cyclase (GGDEF)-like protein